LIGIVLSSDLKGQQNNSFDFQDGDFVTINNNGSPLNEAMEAITIEAWIKPTVSNQDNRAGVMSYLNFGGPNIESGFALLFTQDKYRFIVRTENDDDIGGGGEDNTWPGIPAADIPSDGNTWTHIAGTYSSETSIAKIYKNGVLVETTDESGANPSGEIKWNEIGDASFYIARFIDNYYKGSIDEVRYWRVEKTAEEIQSAMTDVVLGGSENLDGYWNFNDNQSLNVSDVSGNGNPGTLSDAGSGDWDIDVFPPSSDCFDMEITEGDFPFNHLSDLTEDFDFFESVTSNDSWDFENFPGIEGNPGFINGDNGNDYTYKLTLTEPTTFYITTCDAETNIDVQIAIFTADCDMSTWIFFQDDSNSEIVYPDGSTVQYSFECTSGIPGVGTDKYANMLPRLELDAGTYYVVADRRSNTSEEGNGGVRTWFGYSLLVDSTHISESLNSIDYYFNQEVFGGDYLNVYEENGIGLEISDFSVTIEDNGGNATSAEFTSISNLFNNPLSGGEEEIRLNIEYSAPPSGTEIAIISPASVSSVFNVIGVPLLNVEGDSINLVDQVPPTVSFDPDVGDTLVPGIAEIEINFSEPIYLAPSGDSPDALNGMNPESIENFFILSYSDGAEENIDIGAEIDDEFLKVTIQPISLPLIEQRTLLLTINANVLQDFGGNLLNQTNASFQVGDTHSPEIIAQLCSISTSNAYIILSFTEGVYTHINGSGGLDTSDLRRTFDQNLIAGGQATNAKILYLQRPGLSGALEGGEDSIWVYLEITGTPSGFEKITIESKEDEIYDSYGNELVSPNNKTNPITLNRYPWLDEYSLNVNNDYVDLTFSEGVFSAIDNSSPVETGYFEINFNPTNSGHATDAVISLLTNTDDGPLSGGEETIRVRFSISNPPASGAEEIVITPYNAISISNILGNRLSVSDGTTNTISLFDQLDPTITAVNIAPDNIISLTASEDMYNIGSLGINTTDFSYEFYKNNESDSTAAGIQFTDIYNNNMDTILYGGERTVKFAWDPIGGPTSGMEEITISPASSTAIFDTAGNSMPHTTVSERISLPDMFPPKFIPGSASISSDNSYVMFTLTEGVYGDWESNAPAEPSDFYVEFIPNGGNATGAEVAYITNSMQFPLVGGEDILRCYLDIQGTPSGHERLYIRARDDSLFTVFDRRGNSLPIHASGWSPDKATDTLQLFDQLVPTVDSVSIAHGSPISSSIESPIDITFSEPIQSFGYTVSARHYNYLSYITDTTATGFKITLQPPLASLDTITLSIFDLMDSAGLEAVDFSYEFYTPPLGDYDFNGRVNVEDLTQFVSFWMADSQPLILGLGPTSGTFPHLVPELDLNYDLDDGMTFIRMWSWSLERFGLEPLVSPNIGTPINWDKLVVDVPMEAIAGQVYLRYNPNQGKVDLQHSAFGNNNFTLKKELVDHGEVLLEFGLVEPSDDIKIISIKSEIDEPADATVIYKFFAKDHSLIAAGTQKIALVIPTEFRLMQNYPNPFNNTTTIRYAVPEETDIQLEIFDINGRLVETLTSQLHQPGFYDLKWSGRQASSGIYFIKLEAAKTILTQKMILLK